MALLSAAFSVLVLFAVIVASMVGFETSRTRSVSRTEITAQEERAAQSAINLTIDRIWSEFLREYPAQTSGVADVRAWLDSHAIPNQSSLQLRVDDLIGRSDLSGVDVLEIALSRVDDAEETRLIIDVHVRTRRETSAGTASSVVLPGTRRSMIWSIEGEGWQGADFALLTRNLSCAVCHMHVDNAQRFYNEDASLHGTFDMAKVGALDSFRPREKTESTIAGRLYVGRTARLEKGQAVTWSKLGLELARFLDDGKLVEDHWGELTWDAPAPAQPGSHSSTANVFLDYAGGTGEGDGGMPTEFPPIFEDCGDEVDGVGAGDHVVQLAEFNKYVASMSGTLTGGTIAVVPEGAFIGNAAERAALFAGDESLGHSTIGNVVLSGTVDNPLIIDGDVGVFGDLIVRGKIQGKGSIKVSGNVYIIDDLEYIDGTTPLGGRSFGKGAHGGVNSLGIAAGGNIMVGDFIRANKKDDRNLGDTSGEFSFIANELATFNKEEWVRAQPKLPAKGQSLDDPSKWSIVNPKYVGPGYTPRYYALAPGGQLPLLIGQGYYDLALDDWIGAKDAKSWSDKELVLAAPGSPLVAGASVKPIFPSAWIDPVQLNELFLEVRAQRIRERRLTWHVDAALYTSNAIVGLAPKDEDMGTNGTSIINGGILAADFGILSAAGLYLNHDMRSTSGLGIGGGAGVAIARVVVLPGRSM